MGRFARKEGFGRMARLKRMGRRKYAAPIGGVFVLLAATGLFAMVFWTIGATGRLLDNSPEMERIENIVRPVIMWDPPPFENPADLNPILLLQFSIWAALMDENTSYPFNENQEMEVPATDLDVAAARLFGPGIILEHQTFGEYEQSFYFDTVRQIYHVPATVQLFLYSPRVMSIERSGEFYDVRIGYVPPHGIQTANLQGNLSEPAADKYMIYVMRRVGDVFQIVALRDDPAAVGETHMPIAAG